MAHYLRHCVAIYKEDTVEHDMFLETESALPA